MTSALLFRSHPCTHLQRALRRLQLLGGLLQSRLRRRSLLPRLLQLRLRDMELFAKLVQLLLPRAQRALQLYHLGARSLQLQLHGLVLLQGKVDAALFPRRVELRLQALNLLREFLQQRPLGGALVHLGPVANVLGAVRVVQRGERFLQRGQRRRQRRDDAGLGAAAQGLLQQPRKLAVPVRHVRPVLDQGGDYSAQGKQGLVNVPGLACASVLGAGPAHTLAPRQIHQVQLARLHQVLACRRGGGR